MSKTKAERHKGINKQFIAPHFFKHGQYEVWAHRSYGYGQKLQLIASNLSLETAKSFNWPHKEIRLNGKPISEATEHLREPEAQPEGGK